MVCLVFNSVLLYSQQFKGYIFSSHISFSSFIIQRQKNIFYPHQCFSGYKASKRLLSVLLRYMGNIFESKGIWRKHAVAPTFLSRGKLNDDLTEELRTIIHQVTFQGMHRSIRKPTWVPVQDGDLGKFSNLFPPTDSTATNNTRNNFL